MEPVIGLPTALERVDDDRKLLGKLARLFLDEAPARLGRIEEAMRSHNVKVLQETAHTLKGSAGNLAAMAVFEAAKQLEQVARTGDWAQADGAYAVLRSELERLVAVLGDLVARESA